MKFLYIAGLVLFPLFTFGQLKQIALSELSSGSGMFFGAQMSTTTITVTVKGPSDRFIAFGFGAGMNSGDAIVWSTLGTGAAALQLRDHTMAGEQEPLPDAQQDWTVISNTVAAGSRTIVASRALNTGDANDAVFNFSSTSQNLFWSHSQTASNQLANHGTNRANGIVRNWTVVDQTPPTLSTTVPADNAAGISLTSNLTATFNENIAFGAGSITLFDGNNTAIQTVSSGNPAVNISGATLTFNPSANLVINTGYYIQIAPTAITDIAGNAFAGFTDNTTWNFNTNDITAPVLLVSNPFVPADNAAGAVLTTNLAASFSENVQAGTGVIELFSGTNTLVESFDAATSPLITVSNSTVTVNPTADLLPNTDYYVHIAAGAVKDLSGNNFAGISNTTSWNFNTNQVTPPTAVSPFVPADDLTGVDITASLVVTFSEPVVISTTGTLKLFLSDGTLVQSFTSLSSAISVSNTELTITPSATLLDMTAYYVTIDAGFITDLQGNAYAGFTDNQTWNFTTGDFTSPTVTFSALSPLDNATLVPLASTLSITFSEPVAFGTGLIQLVNETSVSGNQVFNVVPGTGLSISGNTVTITPSLFGASSDYHVLIAGTAIEDLSGNAYGGINDVSTWNFSTMSDAGLSGLSEAGITWNGTVLVLPADQFSSGIIFDATGKTIKANLMQSTDCSDLKTGIYFVGLQSENAAQIFRIYVQ